MSAGDETMGGWSGRGSGKVWLVGAGPGDPELLTLKAARVLGEADVVLVDDLVSDAVLAYASPAARVVHVGKRGGCKSTPQAFIERLMIAEAQAGNSVVRLKGGDPFIFGRGGEELDALRAAGIAVEGVNGISAGLAAPSSVGVPLTDRRVGHGVIFVTGHAGESAGEGADAPDWGALAATGMTLVIYMGVTRAAHVESGLLAGGMSREMPVLVVQNATRPDQFCLSTTLEHMSRDIDQAGIASPAIIYVGTAARSASGVVTTRGNDAAQPMQASGAD